MKVILLQDVKPHGKKGEVINVSDGFANNYLFKNKLAQPATADTLNSLSLHAAKVERDKQLEKQRAEELKKQLENSGLELHIRAGETGKVYGSVTAKEISEAFAQQGIEVDKKNIILKEPIKLVGSHTLSAKIYPGVSVTFKVNVIAEK